MALTGLTNLQPLHVHSIGISTFDGSVSVGGTLTYEDVTNVDSIGIITARNGINVSSGTATFQGLIDANGDLDVDGHTNLDNTNIAGVATVSSRLNINHHTYAGLSVAANDRPWRGQFMVKDLDAGNTSSPYMTFWDGNEDSSVENNTGLLGRVGLVNAGASNERFDFWSYKNGTPVSFGTQGAERVRIKANGQVDIASNNYASGHADTKLRVGTESGSSQATAVIGTADQNVPALIITNWDGSATTNKNVIRFDNSGRGTYEIGGVGGANAFAITVDNGEKLRITSNQVLIGTTTSSGYTNRKLVIGDTSDSSNFIEIRTSSSGTGHLLFADSAAADSNNYTGYIGYQHASNAMSFHTNGGNERLRIQSNGYMGLNTTGAQRFFSVKETNNKASLLIWRTSETNGDYSGIDFSGHPSNNGSNYQKGGIYWQTDGSGFGRGDMVFCNDGAANADNVEIGDEKMRIHKEGYVTKPNQPAFRAHDSNHAQTGFLTFDQIATNVGSHYNGSNGRFTAPVAGTYFFSFYGMLASSNGNARVEYYINGSVHSSGEHYGGVAYTNNQTYNMITCNTVLTLSANDYVNLNWNGSYNSMHSYHNGFMGFLIG